MRELDEELSLIFTRAEAGNGHVFQLAVYPSKRGCTNFTGKDPRASVFPSLIGMIASTEINVKCYDEIRR